MSRLSHRCAALVAALLLAAAPAIAQDAAHDSEPQAKAVTIEQLLRAPESYRNVPCEFEMVFHEFTQHYNPYFTRFVSETYVNFAAWGAAQPIWQRAEFNSDFPYLFVSKANPTLPKFMQMKRFERIRMVGVIRDTFRGKPWIEVVAVTPISGKLTEKALIHRVRGDAAAARKHHRIAAREYRAVIEQSGLPSEFVLDSTKQLGIALYRARDYKAAQEVFTRLLSMTPDDPDARSLASQAASRSRNPIRPTTTKRQPAPVPWQKPQAKPQPVPESLPAIKLAPQPKPVPKPQPKLVPQPQPQPKAEAKPKPVPAPKPIPAPKAAPKPEPKPEPKTAPKPEPKPAPQPESADPSLEPSPFEPLPSQRTGDQ